MEKNPDPVVRKNKFNVKGQWIAFTRYFDGDRCLLAVAGELKHGQTHVLYDEVVSIFESGVRDVIIDLRDVSYTDTVGLQNLVMIYKYVKDNERLDFSVLVPEGEIWEILVSCRFDKFINITRDESTITGDWLQS